MAKKRRLKKELEKMAGDIDFLMEHLKENGENSGAYMGTVLFLNEDSKEVEAALLGEILQAKQRAGEWMDDIEMAVWLTEQQGTLLRLAGKFNECRDMRGRYGKHYALDLDVDELCLLERILEDAGITYWNY